MAEIEFSVLSRSCLRQRLPDEEALGREVQALVAERNTAHATINWRFNTHDARTKLHRLYPFDSKHDRVLACRRRNPAILASRALGACRTPTAGACDIRGCQTPHVVSFGCTFDGA